MTNTSFILTSESPIISSVATPVKYEYPELSGWEEEANCLQIAVSVVLLCLWVLFLIFYLSHLSGILVGWILNMVILPYFLGVSAVKVRCGRFAVSVVSGKIIVHDLVAYSNDVCARVDDGSATFAYWRPFRSRPMGVDLSQEASRLHCWASVVDVQLLNQVEKYRSIGRVRGLTDLLTSLFDDTFDSHEVKTSLLDDQFDTRIVENADKRHWKLLTLIAGVKADVDNCRLVVGNWHLETALVVSASELRSSATVLAASNGRDLFRYLVLSSCTDLVTSFVPTASSSRGASAGGPPRLMGDGFELLRTSRLDCRYEQEAVGLGGQQAADDDDAPVWRSYVRMGKNTKISYGPWADKQRNHLYDFFWPAEQRQTDHVLLSSSASTRRVHTKHDTRVTFDDGATFDLWYQNSEETKTVQMTVRKGANMKISIPFVFGPNGGYNLSAEGEAMGVELTTGLAFHQFLQCEVVNFSLLTHYPPVWNQQQKWHLKVSALKGSVWFLFDHKTVCQEILADWSSSSKVDLLRFVPYSCQLDITLRDCELLLCLNDMNWIDTTSTKSAQNTFAALAAPAVRLQVTLPFEHFAPELVSISLTLDSEPDSGLLVSIKYPPESVNGILLRSQQRCATTRSRLDSADEPQKKFWRKQCQTANGYTDVWLLDSFHVDLMFTYHPVPPPHFDGAIGQKQYLRDAYPELKFQPLDDMFDPGDLVYDRLAVNVDLGPSDLKFNGLLIREILHLKNNYFGAFQTSSDVSGFHKQQDSAPTSTFGQYDTRTVRREAFRALAVRLSLKLHDLVAHCQLSSLADASPICLLKQVAVELDKSHSESLFQVATSPLLLHWNNDVETSGRSDAYMTVSSFQLRGDGMFSQRQLVHDAPTVEYAWLLEVACGDVGGRIHPSNVASIADWLETLLIMVANREDDLQTPNKFDFCQHQVPRLSCHETLETGVPCLTEFDLKYLLLRVSLDSVDFHLLQEERQVVRIAAKHVRLSTCNYHFPSRRDLISLLLSSVHISQLVQLENDRWLECGVKSVSHVKLKVTLPNDQLVSKREAFLRKHDERSKRLNFLYGSTCGCYGDVHFFGQDNLFDLFAEPLVAIRPLLSERDGRNLPTNVSLLDNGKRLVEYYVYMGKREDLKKSGNSPASAASGLSAEVESGSFSKPTSSRRSSESFRTANEETDATLMSYLCCTFSQSPLVLSLYSKALAQFKSNSTLKAILPMPTFEQHVNDWLDENGLTLVGDQLGVNKLCLTETCAENSPSADATQLLNDTFLSDGLNVCADIGGPLQVFFTPIALECLQSLIEAVATHFTRPHPWPFRIEWIRSDRENLSQDRTM